MRRLPTRARAHAAAVRLIALGALLAGFVVAVGISTAADTESIVVTAEVPAASTLDTTGCSRGGAPYRDQVLADNPVGYWPMDDLAGAVMDDASTTANDGAYVNGPTLGADGGLDTATENTSVRFDGVNDRATVPHLPAYQLDAFTVEMWISSADIAVAAGEYPRLISSGPTGLNRNYVLYFDDTGSTLQASFSTDGTTRRDISAATDIIDGGWHHVALTVGGGMGRLYIDGAQVGTVSYTGNIDNPNEQLRIGGYPFGDFFPGSIDEVAVYPSPLDADDIADHHAAGAAGFKRMDLGLIQPGTEARTGDCVVRFGSNNSSAMLKMYQSDQVGKGMILYPPGDSDETFDGVISADGHLVEPYAGADDVSNAIAAGERIVAVGRSVGGGGSDDFSAVRYLPNGVLDPDFGCAVAGTCSGRRLIDIAGNSTDVANDVLLQPDGKLVMVGTSSTANGNVAVVRLNANGTPDTDFGCATAGTCTGIANLDIGASTIDAGTGIAIRPDGRFIISGNSANDFLALGLRANGTLDPAFGCAVPGTCSGVRTLHIGWNNVGGAAAVDAAGRLLVSGVEVDVCCHAYSVMQRFDEDGMPDATFDTDGVLVNTLFPYHGASDILVQPDGKILLSGYSGVLRLLPSGALDASFGTGGGAAIGSDGNIALQGDGKVVLPGYFTWGGNADIAARRLLADGAIDTAFGETGVASPHGWAGDQVGTAAVPLPDGRIAIVGDHNAGGSFEMVTWMMRAESFSNYDMGVANTDWGAPDTNSMFGVCLSGLVNAAQTWAPAAGCPMADDGTWRAVPELPDGTAKVASAAMGADARATLVFGAKAATDQPPGGYVAPITFEVISPNAP